MSSHTNPLARFDSLLYRLVYLGESQSELDREIRRNMAWISLGTNECRLVSVHDLMELADELIRDRDRQVRRLNLQLGATFYLWFDEQACQLRFNVISGRDAPPPFGCRVTFVESAEAILAAFLRSPFHNGIPWDSLSETDSANEEASEDAPLAVYRVGLSRDGQEPAGLIEERA